MAAYVDQVVLVGGGSSSASSGTSARQTVTQTAHGFTGGEVLYNLNGTWTKAKADALSTSYAIGIVESAPTVDTFIIVYSGVITLSGLTASSLYYLSDATAGLLTATAPTAAGSFVLPVLRTGTTTAAYVTIGAPASNALIGAADISIDGNLAMTVPTVDGTCAGPTVGSFNCGYSSSAVGDLVYLDSSSTWQKCDANTLLLYNGLLGIAMEVKASGAALIVALPGSFVYATGFPTFTVGLPIYMSETAGAVTHTAPTTADAASRIVGWGVHADKMYFFPSPDYTTHT